MTFQSGDRIFIDDKQYCLFLIDITFRTPDGDAGLEYVFPNITSKIKATWYSGELRIPLGGPVKPKDDSYLSWHILTESDWFINMEKGIVVSQRYKANPIYLVSVDETWVDYLVLNFHNFINVNLRKKFILRVNYN